MIVTRQYGDLLTTIVGGIVSIIRPTTAPPPPPPPPPPPDYTPLILGGVAILGLGGLLLFMPMKRGKK